MNQNYFFFISLKWKQSLLFYFRKIGRLYENSRNHSLRPISTRRMICYIFGLYDFIWNEISRLAHYQSSNKKKMVISLVIIVSCARWCAIHYTLTQPIDKLLTMRNIFRWYIKKNACHSELETSLFEKQWKKNKWKTFIYGW